MLDERLGKITFWTLFIGFHGTFLVQHWLGAEGMPRRYADYLAADGFTTLNTISTISSFLLGLSIAAVPLQRVEDRQVRQEGRGRRPVGLRPLAGVGDLLPAAAAQLPHPAADPLRIPGVRPAPPGDRGARVDQLEANGGHRRVVGGRWTRCGAVRKEDRQVKIQGKMFLWLPVFILAHGHRLRLWSKEPAGTTALFLAFGLCHDRLLPGLHGPAGRRGPRTTRRPTSRTTPVRWASSARTAGSRSRWARLARSPSWASIFGWWLLYFSAPIILLGLFGWVFEYYRGENRTSNARRAGADTYGGGRTAHTFDQRASSARGRSAA